MTDEKHYQKVKDLYDRLDANGQQTVREMYPECFTITLPKTIDEVYNHCGGLTTIRRNVPLLAAGRFTAFADLLAVEYALNNGAEGNHTCAVNLGDCKPVAYRQTLRSLNPSYTFPIFLDQEKMTYALETFPDLFNNLICSKQS